MKCIICGKVISNMDEAVRTGCCSSIYVHKNCRDERKSCKKC